MEALCSKWELLVQRGDVELGESPDKAIKAIKSQDGGIPGKKMVNEIKKED